MGRVGPREHVNQPILSLNDKLAQAAARVARELGARVDLASMRDFNAPPRWFAIPT
jgi:hypothetical protein